MPFLWQDSCRRILELNVRNSILVLWICRKLLIGAKWKDNIESKGMRVNMNKTKVMISAERQKVR